MRATTVVPSSCRSKCVSDTTQLEPLENRHESSTGSGENADQASIWLNSSFPTASPWPAGSVKR